MNAEDLFAAIGNVETSRLERSELTADQSSLKKQEDMKMSHKSTKKLLRNLMIAAVITALLSVTAYAVVNERIRLKTTKYQFSEIVPDAPTDNYNVEIDFQRTTNEYLELGSVYPQSIPDGYTLSFVSDKALGMQNIVYADSNGKEAIRFIAQLGCDGGQIELMNVKSEEAVTIGDCTGTLYRYGTGSQAIVWQNEEQGIGFTLLTQIPNLDIDLLAIAQSVGPGEPLTPTLSAGYDTALAELGDYRITALPDGFTETDFMASPLENGGGWYAYVRRWYSDKVTTDNTIYFEYEHFTLTSDEPTNHPTEPVDETPETVIANMGGGEAVTILGMPGAIHDDCAIWVDWNAQVAFQIKAPGRTAEEVLALANSVQKLN